MKSVLLICPAVPTDMPYLLSYIDCLESYNIGYDVIYISWENEKNTFPKNYYMYDVYNACNNSNSLSPCLRCRFNRNFIFFLLFMPLHDKLFPESHNSKTDVVFYSYKNQTTLSGNAIIVLRFRDDPNIRIHI